MVSKGTNASEQSLTAQEQQQQHATPDAILPLVVHSSRKKRKPNRPKEAIAAEEAAKLARKAARPLSPR